MALLPARSRRIAITTIALPVAAAQTQQLGLGERDILGEATPARHAVPHPQPHATALGPVTGHALPGYRQGVARGGEQAGHQR